LHRTTVLKRALAIMAAPAILPVIPREKHRTPTKTRKVARDLASYRKPKLLAMCLATCRRLNSKQQRRQEKALGGEKEEGREGGKESLSQNTELECEEC